MNPYVVAGVTVGGLLLASQSRASRPAGTAGDAIAAAMSSLSTTIAGVSFQIDPSFDASNTYGAMRRAMVAKFGPSPSAPIDTLTGAGSLPTGMSGDQLVEMMTAWLAAFDAGRAASGAAQKNFAISTVPMFTTCGMAPEESRTKIGSAACALSAYRDHVDSVSIAFDADQVAQQAFSLVSALASEMDGADYVGTGERSSEQGWQWSDVPGGIAAAGSASLSAVEGAAEAVAGDVAGLVVGSSLFWLVGLAAAAYFVLR